MRGQRKAGRDKVGGGRQGRGEQMRYGKEEEREKSGRERRRGKDGGVEEAWEGREDRHGLWCKQCH